jgi:large subunit ribosomal protein L10
MARPDKTTAVAELAEDFRTANATVLTEYRGLSVTSMKELRRALGATTKYSVVKNTLTKIAAKDAGVEIADDLLTGPSAVAFIKGDPINAAKSLRDFAKENPFLSSRVVFMKASQLPKKRSCSSLTSSHVKFYWPSLLAQ